MSTKKTTTFPNLLDTSPKHKKALASGNDHFRSWAYNVIDEFKPLTVDEIKDRLDKTAFPYAVAFENVLGDFNISTGVRNANAFNAKEIFYVGNRSFDKRGSLGSLHYKPIKWIPTIDEFIKLKEYYTLVAVDNMPGAISIDKFDFKENMLFVFGEEGVGLTPLMQSLCDCMIYIEQFGSIRSINVGCASAIIMHRVVSHFTSKR